MSVTFGLILLGGFLTLIILGPLMLLAGILIGWIKWGRDT